MKLPQAFWPGYVCLGVTNRRVLTCGGEFNSRHIVRRSVQKALDDPKSSTRPQVRQDHPLTTDRAQVPWKGAPEGESPIVPGPCRFPRALSQSQVVWECSPIRRRTFIAWSVFLVIVLCTTILTACLGICVLRASACGLPHSTTS
ncbi:unnamed protein product [Brassica napus]|nr:unnamed protein product [Brassica napus]